MKLWRPQFSLRTLLVLVTLTCAYFAAWEVTKRYGVRTLEAEVTNFGASSPMPFVVRITTERQSEILRAKNGSQTITGNVVSTRKLFVWVFGWNVQTPIEWETREVSSDMPGGWL